MGRCHFPVFCRANAILFAEQTIKSARYIKATTESYRLNRKFGMAVELPACLFHFQSTHILHGRFSSNGFDGICQCVLIGAKCGDISSRLMSVLDRLSSESRYSCNRITRFCCSPEGANSSVAPAVLPESSGEDSIGECSPIGIVHPLTDLVL